MAEVELAEDTLIVHVRGMDQLWARRSRLEIPLSHVVGCPSGSAGDARVVARRQDRWNAHAGGHHSGHLPPGG